MLSYLTADPAEIIAVDLNGAHIALNRLKSRAAASPDHETFFSFFGRAEPRDKIAPLRRTAAPATRRGDARLLGGRDLAAAAASTRSPQFLSSWLAGTIHRRRTCVAKLYGANPTRMLQARDARRAAARLRHARSRRRSRSLRALARAPAGLALWPGHPALAIRALSSDCPDGIADVLKQRVERLGLRLSRARELFCLAGVRPALRAATIRSVAAALPAARHFEAFRGRADRVRPHHGSLTDLLRAEPAQSFDAYVLLDAQDWMNDAT